MICLRRAVVWRLWFRIANAAVSYARFFKRSHDAVIRVFDVAGNVIEIHRYTCDFKDREWI